MKKSMVVIGLFILLIAGVLVSGCLTMNTYTTVDKNGKITDLKTELNLSKSAYDTFKSWVAPNDSSYEDYKNQMIQSYRSNFTGTDVTVDYSEKPAGDDYMIITLDAHGTDLQPISAMNTNVTKDGDYWVFNCIPSDINAMAGDSSLSGSDYADYGISENYYLTMPGNIVSTNADSYSGNHAEWHYASNKQAAYSSLYAKSEMTSKSPGFEPVIALLALVAGVYVLAMRKKE